MDKQKSSYILAGLGTPVYGDRFVGRHDEIKTIEDRIINNSLDNVSIVGLHKVGKTSLVLHTLISQRQILYDKNIIVVYSQLSNFTNSKDFYIAVLNDIDEQMTDDIQLSRWSDIRKTTLERISSETTISEIRELTMKLFRKINKLLGFHCILVLDEFDSATKVFSRECNSDPLIQENEIVVKGETEFQILRELGSMSVYNVSLVTLSRRDLGKIEVNSTAPSLFSQIFGVQIHLKMYSSEELSEYWARLRFAYPLLTLDYRNRAEYTVGGHPYLLDKYNDCCIRREVFDKPNKDDLIVIRKDADALFASILHRLDKDNLLKIAVQIIRGPVYEEYEGAIDYLKLYGFIKAVPTRTKQRLLGSIDGVIEGQGVEEKGYICFSDYFTKRFAFSYYTALQYWLLWNETENALRRMIKSYVDDCFGDDWEEEFIPHLRDNGISEDSLKNCSTNFQRLKKEREKAIIEFGDNAFADLVDYTHTSDIFNTFIRNDWEWFEDVLGENYGYWCSVFSYLTKIRNAHAHSNADLVSDIQKEQAVLYCRKILDIIQTWEKECTEVVE